MDLSDPCLLAAVPSLSFSLSLTTQTLSQPPTSKLGAMHPALTPVTLFESLNPDISMVYMEATKECCRLNGQDIVIFFGFDRSKWY